MVMPDIDGKALFAILQRDPKLCSIRVLGLTALGAPPDEEALPCPTITKPVGLGHLLRTVAEALVGTREMPPS